MTKNDLINNEAFKTAPDNAVMAYKNIIGEFFLLGEPARCFKSVVRFTSGIGMTKEDLMKTTAFKMARPDAELEVELSDCVRVFLFGVLKLENGYLMITDKF